MLKSIRTDIEQLKRANSKLRRENDRLKEELEQSISEEQDIFSSIGEAEKIALKHQIDGLITKIDNRLND